MTADTCGEEDGDLPVSESVQRRVDWNRHLHEMRQLAARFLHRTERVKALGVFEPFRRLDCRACQHGHTRQEKDEVGGKQAKSDKDHTG